MGALSNILIVAYLLIVLALIAVILLQRSEGGGLGMGTSSNNGLISVRGSANLLTRTTAILAALFFATAIGLTILSELDRPTDAILDGVVQDGGAQPTTVLDALQKMQQQSASDLPVPATDPTAPASTTPAVPATDSSLPVPAATDAAPATTETPAATTPAAPAAESTAPAAATPAAPAATEQPAAATSQPAAPAN
jgi:preprotein translocase subunit SecG